jgi:5-methylcytosine-specific restriction endonuclease McrA
MNFDLLKSCNRGGDIYCYKCNTIKYMTPGHVQKMTESICSDCYTPPKVKKPRKHAKVKRYTLSWKDVPPEIQERARKLCLDGVSCAENARIVKVNSNSLYNALYKKSNATSKEKPILTLEEKLTKRIYSFCNAKPTFTLKQFLDKVGAEPKCYLTGVPIDLSDTSSYHLDHIIPSSRGGDNSLENCGLASAAANKAKSDLTLDEFRHLCRLVIENE